MANLKTKFANIDESWKNICNKRPCSQLLTLCQMFWIELRKPKNEKLWLSKFDKYQNEKMNFPRKIDFVKTSVFNFVGWTIHSKAFAIVSLVTKHNGLNTWIQIRRPKAFFWTVQPSKGKRRKSSVLFIGRRKVVQKLY